MHKDELQEELDDARGELSELGELWLEAYLDGDNTVHIEKAIEQVTRITRGLERRLR